MSNEADMVAEFREVQEVAVALEIEQRRIAEEFQEGSPYCVECGLPIPEARREALPWATLCVPCKELEDVMNRHR